MDGNKALHDMADEDFRLVLRKLTEIMEVCSEMAQSGLVGGHRAYIAARDARDAMMFDAMSRETMRRLTGTETWEGHPVTAEVLAFMRAGQKINAIKEVRGLTGMGLKEAKDWVEGYIEAKGIVPTF